MKYFEAYLDLNVCFETYSDNGDGLSEECSTPQNILSDNNNIYTKLITYYQLPIKVAMTYLFKLLYGCFMNF